MGYVAFRRAVRNFPDRPHNAACEEWCACVDGPKHQRSWLWKKQGVTMDVWRELGVSGPARGMYWVLHEFTSPEGVYWGDYVSFCGESRTTVQQRASQRRYWNELIEKGMLVPVPGKPCGGFWLRCYQGVDRVAPEGLCASCGKRHRPAAEQPIYNHGIQVLPFGSKGGPGVAPVRGKKRGPKPKLLKAQGDFSAELELRNYSLNTSRSTSKVRASAPAAAPGSGSPPRPAVRREKPPADDVVVVIQPQTASRMSEPRKAPSRVSGRRLSNSGQQALWPEEKRKEESEAVQELLSEIIDSLQSDGDTCTRLKEAADGYRQRMQSLR